MRKVKLDTEKKEFPVRLSSWKLSKSLSGILVATVAQVYLSSLFEGGKSLK